jgi:hypothetical protein
MEGNTESGRFIQVDQVEDPFTTDALEAVLKQAGIPVIRTDHPGGSGVEALGSGWALPWWELSVPEGDADRARQLLRAERARLVAEAPEAEKAAEEEEREGEQKQAAKPSA